MQSDFDPRFTNSEVQGPRYTTIIRSELGRVTAGKGNDIDVKDFGKNRNAWKQSVPSLGSNAFVQTLATSLKPAMLLWC